MHRNHAKEFFLGVVYNHVKLLCVGENKIGIRKYMSFIILFSNKRKVQCILQVAADNSFENFFGHVQVAASNTDHLKIYRNYT